MPKSVTESPNTSRATLKNSQGTVQCSLTVCSRTRKRKEYNLNVRTSKVRWGTLKYLVTFFLLAVTWTRGSHPVVHVPSSGASLTWAQLLTLFRLSYFMHGTAQCIANLERDLYWDWRVRVPSYTFPVVSPAAFIICTTFVFGDMLAPAISNHLVA